MSITPGGPPDPPPDPPWWRRIRWGYHTCMAAAAFPLSGPWAWILAYVRKVADANAKPDTVARYIRLAS